MGYTYIFILRTIFGRTESAIAYKKKTLEEKISTKRNEIYNIKTHSHDIDLIEINVLMEFEGLNKETHERILLHASQHISSQVVQSLNKLKKHYEIILSSYFLEGVSRSKIEEELTLTIGNKFPYNFCLSEKFHNDFIEILSLFKIDKPKLESIKDKVLFNEMISADELLGSPITSKSPYIAPILGEIYNGIISKITGRIVNINISAGYSGISSVKYLSDKEVGDTVRVEVTKINDKREIYLFPPVSSS